MSKLRKIKVRKLQFKSYNQTVEIPIRCFLKEPVFTFGLMRKISVKLAAFILIISLNWLGLSTIIQTSAYFNDTETSLNNIYSVATLDFSLTSPNDFSPLVTPTATSSRSISLINNGSLDFQYTVQIENATGTLCDYLNLNADLNSSSSVYSGSLTGFNYNAGEFSTSTKDWQFIATLTGNDPALQNQTCKFDFVFDGAQTGGLGFSDQEIISNTITSGLWLKAVINKVYYNVDSSHGTEPNNEWVELYNPADLPIDISNWKICDNTNCDTIPGSFTSLQGKGFAIITNKSSTWDYWNIPDGVVKIVLNNSIGGGLSNDNDIVLLKDFNGNIIDQMNWGAPTSTWPNYNPSLWDPGVPTVVKGNMLARVPTGFDTDSVSDWRDLGLPQVTVIWPNGEEVLWVGHTETLTWSAVNPNGPDSDLNISLWYSKDSGNTWANIVSSTENDGAYDWKIPLYIGSYYIPSNHARIKVVATGPENFMVQSWDMSDKDFCPPIDYALITDEEKAQIKDLLAQGVIQLDEIINFDGQTPVVFGGGEIAVENPPIIIETVVEQTTTTLTVQSEESSSTQEISTSTLEENNATSTEEDIQPMDIEVVEIAENYATENSTSTDTGTDKVVIEEQPIILPEETAVVENPPVENPAPETNSGSGADSGTNSDTGAAPADPVITEPS